MLGAVPCSVAGGLRGSGKRTPARGVLEEFAGFSFVFDTMGC